MGHHLQQVAHHAIDFIQAKERKVEAHLDDLLQIVQCSASTGGPDQIGLRQQVGEGLLVVTQQVVDIGEATNQPHQLKDMQQLDCGQPVQVVDDHQDRSVEVSKGFLHSCAVRLRAGLQQARTHVEHPLSIDADISSSGAKRGESLAPIRDQVTRDAPSPVLRYGGSKL